MEKQLIKEKKSSEKSFAVVFAMVFFLIGIFPLIGNNDVRWWALIISTVLLALGFTYPKIFTKPNDLWFRFGLLLGAIIAPITMALVYLIVIVPTGLILRLVRYDPLAEKLDPKATSYWLERTEKIQSFKNQF